MVSRNGPGGLSSSVAEALVGQSVALSCHCSGRSLSPTSMPCCGLLRITFALWTDLGSFQVGTTLIITALFVYAGVQQFFMGFIGEYVLSIFNQVRTLVRWS